MDDLKQALALLGVVIAGGFLFLIGAIFMTGVRLDNAGDIAIFVAWNGFVLAVVVAGIASVVRRAPPN